LKSILISRCKICTSSVRLNRHRSRTLSTGRKVNFETQLAHRNVSRSARPSATFVEFNGLLIAVQSPAQFLWLDRQFPKLNDLFPSKFRLHKVRNTRMLRHRQNMVNLETFVTGV
jgi:hypothetical protein